MSNALTDVSNYGNRNADYYSALGNLVDAHANVESIMHMLFHHVSKLEPLFAQAITGRMGLKQLMPPILKICELNDLEETEEIKSLFDQINHLTELRHTLVHRSAQFINGEWVSTNIHSLKDFNSYEVLRLQLKDINHARLDLRRIYLRIIKIITPGKEFSEGDQKEIFQAWSYKRVRPETPNQRPRTKGPKHRPRRGASPK